MEIESTSVTERRLPIRFVASGSEYFRIWIVNLLLTLVTLGLYYPYAKVRRLRYFHGATEIDGQPLSFHAEPGKMLRGYLLVGALAGVYGLAGKISPVAGLVAFAIIAALWPALWHSSLRFRLANTGWRGLRMRFTGSRGGAYAALAPGFAAVGVLVALGAFADPEQAAGPSAQAEPASPWWIAVALLPLALMLMMPWLLWLLRRYQHRHYALAGEETRFEVPATAFYGLALRTVGLSMLAALLAAGVVALVAYTAGAEAGAPESPAGLLGFAGVLLAFVCLQLALRPYLTSRLQNLVWNGTRSQHLRFESRLRFGPLLALTARNWLLMVVTLGLYYPFAAVATARLRLQAVDVMTRVDPAVLAGQRAGAGETAAGDAAGDLLGLDIGL